MQWPLCRQLTPPRRGKRKLPLPDLDAIQDVEERRRQRRLIKNRNTAAASRCIPLSFTCAIPGLLTSILVELQLSICGFIALTNIVSNFGPCPLLERRESLKAAAAMS